MRDECENRDVNCDKCDAPMKYKDLNYHQLCQCECGLVRCQNDGCGWSGFRRSEADHRLKCLYLQVTCTHCLMELIQKEMPGHQCDQVDMSAPCSVCLESFSRLERKEIPPVMMLINNRRSCAHAHCLKCAQSWYQRNAEQGLAPCPVCRAEYDSTTPFPDYLLQRETKRRRRHQPVIRPPLPPQEEMKPGKQFFVSPLDVRFTHDSISECFAPYVKDGEQLTNKERLKVLSSAKELLDGDEEPKALEMLDVVWYQKELYVAGTFNRRLCMYRLLALFATERFGLIKVQVKSQDELRQKFSKSLTTKCKGQTVKIRTQNNNSEEFQVGQSREELHWPEAVEALGGGDLEEMSPSQSETEEETPSPLQTPVQSKQSPSDLDRVIAATAEFHRMPLDQVRQVLRQLNQEQRWLTCKRFRHDPEFGGTCPAIKRFEKYVQSCLSNGFLERHSMDRDSDGCFEKILKASGVQNPGTISQATSGRSLRSTDPGAPAFPPPASRAACAARSLSPRKAAASRTFPEPRPPSMAEGSAGAGAAGNSSVSFKAPPATFGTFGRDRSPGRSSVKAPPSCREPRPPVKAPPPPPPAPSSASEVMELRQRLEEMQKRELERMNEKTGLLHHIQTLEEKNALLEDENASLLGRLSMEKEQHQQEVQDLQRSYDLVLQQLEELQDSRGSGAAETTRPTPPPPPSRRSRWAAKKEAEEASATAEAEATATDQWDPWWSGEDPWVKDPAVDPGESPESPEDPWKSYDTAAVLQNDEDIQHFAEHWELEVNKVHEILAGLKAEEINMVLRRFHVSKWKGSVEGLLWKYVESCRRNGFKKDHPTDTLVHFASSWGMAFDEVKELLEKLSLEQQTQVITEFCHDDADYSDALSALRSYVGYLSDYDFQPPEKWEAFAKKWKIPAQDVAAIFRRLKEEQVDIVVRRFVHNGYSKQVSASAQLKSYVRSCVANGFWVHRPSVEA